MYLNFIFVPLDYFRTLGFRKITFDWIFPAIISFLVFLSLYKGASSYGFNDYLNKIISLEGILVGFSITSITFLTTASNRNIEGLQKHLTKLWIGEKNLTLMDLVIVNFSFSLFIEVLILVVNLTAPILVLSFGLSFQTKIILFSINILFVLHNLFLNIRNLVDLYLALMKK